MKELNRRVTTLFINRVLVFEKSRIQIKYSFDDALAEAYEHLKAIRLYEKREAV